MAKINGEEDYPHYSAILILSFTTLCNVLTLLMLLAMLSGPKAFGHVELPKIAVPGSIIALMLLHYFALIRNGRYREIRQEFDSDGFGQRRDGWVLMWAYIVGSILLFFGIVFIQIQINLPAIA